MTQPQSPEPSQDTRSATAKAMDLVSQITSISLTAVLPALGGYFLDGYLETQVLFVILGLLAGMGMAGLQLIKLVQRLERNNSERS